MADFKELRKKHELTQAQLADMLDVSVNTIQNWERGRNLPSGDNLNKYLKALGITNQVDITRIIGEISTANYNEENADTLGNVPTFLFADDSQEFILIRNCYATAEELDMLGYAEYVKWDSKYSRLERRGDTKFPLEFAFFEKYGGFNATMKKLSEARARLGRLRGDALEFAERNPGCDYRLVSFDEKDVIRKLGILFDIRDYQAEIDDLYNCLKTIEAVGTDPLSVKNAIVRSEKSREINRILQNGTGYMTNEYNLGKLSGYVELEMDNPNNKPNISMLRLTERGKQLIRWGDEKRKK